MSEYNLDIIFAIILSSNWYLLLRTLLNSIFYSLGLRSCYVQLSKLLNSQELFLFSRIPSCKCEICFFLRGTITNTNRSEYAIAILFLTSNPKVIICTKYITCFLSHHKQKYCQIFCLYKTWVVMFSAPHNSFLSACLQ